jgi:hypothetical protein
VPPLAKGFSPASLEFFAVVPCHSEFSVLGALRIVTFRLRLLPSVCHGWLSGSDGPICSRHLQKNRQVPSANGIMCPCQGIVSHYMYYSACHRPSTSLPATGTRIRICSNHIGQPPSRVLCGCPLSISCQQLLASPNDPVASTHCHIREVSWYPPKP